MYLDHNLGNYVPKEVTIRLCEDALLWIQGYPVLPTSLKYFLDMVQVVWLMSREDCYVIEVYHYALSEEPTKSDVHYVLKCSTYVYQLKQYSTVREHAPLGTEGCFQSVRFYYSKSDSILRNCLAKRTSLLQMLSIISEINVQADLPGLLSDRD